MERLLNFGGVAVMTAFIFAMALGVLWFFLPFAFFGIKDRLDSIHKALRGINATLSALKKEKTGANAAEPGGTGGAVKPSSGNPC